jgi:hypothetical protein
VPLTAQGSQSRRSLLKTAGEFVFGLVIFAVLFLAVSLYLHGMVWVSESLTPWLLKAASTLFDVCVFVFLPLCIFKRTRPWAGLGFFLSSWVFGVALFMLSCLVAFRTYGYGGLLGGLFLGGLGVIPVAWFAALFHGLGDDAALLITIGIGLTVGTYCFGQFLLTPRLVRPSPERGQETAVANDQLTEHSFGDSPILKKALTEQEAAALFVVSMLRGTQHAWPTVFKTLKELREEKFLVEDQSKAALDLGLAAIAQGLQAVKNLFPIDQSARIEKLVLTWVFKCMDTKDRGDYAVGEVKEYGAAFQKESKIGPEFALGAIPGRLLHRWLGEGINDFEGEIGGKKTGLIDVMLMAETTNVVIGFSGTWKQFKDKFKLVEGAPKYTLTKTKICENFDKTDQIMTDQSLTDAQRSVAINELSED